MVYIGVLMVLFYFIIPFLYEKEITLLTERYVSYSFNIGFVLQKSPNVIITNAIINEYISLMGESGG